MRRRTRIFLKRSAAVMMALSLLVTDLGGYGVTAMAAEEKAAYHYLPTATMPKEIQASDAFYVGTTSANLKEDTDGSYLLLIGRGGDATEAANVTLKISDMTATYGEDYKIRAYSGKKEEAENPEDNYSLMNLIEENRDKQKEELLGDREEQEKRQEEAEKALMDALAEKQEESKAEDAKGDGAESSSKSSNGLRGAVQAQTGIKSDREAMNSTQQTMVDALSTAGNALTEMVQGATLQVDFRPGEKEKFVEMIPVDNDKSDGNRIFYVTLSEPSEGMTNSAVSESIFTIKDDEPEETAQVSFEKAEAKADGETVALKLMREGAINQTVSVHVKSKAGTAVSGRDFAPVDADVTFPFGIKEREISITINPQYLTEAADFSLSLSNGAGAEKGKVSEAKITIEPDRLKVGNASASDSKKKVRSSEDEEVSGQGNTLGDVKYGKTLDLSKITKVRGSGKASTYKEEEENDEDGIWRLDINKDHWLDASLHLSGKDSSETMWIYDGFRFSWKKTSKKPTWSGHNIAVYRKNKTSDAKVFLSQDDNPRFKWNEKAYYFGIKDPADLKIYLQSDGGHGADIYVDWVKPILRAFKVTAKQANTLSYRAWDGTKEVEKTGEALQTQLIDSAGGYAVKYAGDSIVLQAMNSSKAYLSGVKIWNNLRSKEISSKYYKINGNTLTIPITNEFIDYYGNGANGNDYIKWEKNESKGGDSIQGTIEVQPIYSKYKTKIKVKNNEELTSDKESVTGKLKINGTVKEPGIYTYNIGDIICLSTDLTNTSSYTSAGVEEVSLNSATKKDGRGTLSYDENDSYQLELGKDAYTLMPLVGEKKNRVVVRVEDSQMKYFQFEQKKIDEAVHENGHYDLLISDADATKQGEEICLAAMPVSGYQAVWKETNGNHYFQGNNYYYEVKDRPVANIVYLYAGVEGEDYTSVKGKLYYQNTNLLVRGDAGDPILPAEYGFVTIGNAVGMADEAGAFATQAFKYVSSIKIAGNETIKFTSKNPLYAQACIAASGNEEYIDVALQRSGSKSTVSDGTKNVQSYVKDLGTQTLRVNVGGAPTFDWVSVLNKNIATYGVLMNDEITKLSVQTTPVDGENIIGIKFIVYDGFNNKPKKEYDAKKNGTLWNFSETFTSEDSEDYAQGDKLYVQMTTDKKRSYREDAGEGKANLTEEMKKELEKTTYPPVNTGLAFIKTGAYEKPTVQNIDLGTVGNFEGIPLVSNFACNLTLGPVRLAVIDRYDDKGSVCGTRIQAGLSLDIAKKTRFASDNYDFGGDGVDYGGFFHKLGNLSDTMSKAVQSIKSASLAKNYASFGAPKWGIYPIVGFYMDFANTYETDAAGNRTNEHLEVQGGGIYFGGAANISVAWYAIVPVVMIPCYFGVAGDLSLLMNAGGTTYLGTEKDPDSFVTASHNLTESMEFDFQLMVAGRIQVYCGVGICGTLGVRGGMQVSADFVWYPAQHEYNPIFDDIGYDFNVEFKMWVDLALFSIPITLGSVANGKYGLLKQYENLSEGKNIDGSEKKKAASSGSGGEEVYTLKSFSNRAPVWNGDASETEMDQVSSLATYKEKNNFTIEENGYDRPNAKLLDMGENGTLLVFLQKDMKKADSEITTICYSVYKDGKYSTPQVIQTDSTADFSPNVCDAGDNVVISWISSDPDVIKAGVDDEAGQKAYLNALEVYSVEVAKASLAGGQAVSQDGIERLTNDTMYDTNPFAIYDDATGEYNVYFTKIAADDSADVSLSDYGNPMNTTGKTYSAIAYRVHNKEEGWLVDSYKAAEKADDVTDEAYKEQLIQWGGQRFLSSPIKNDDIDMEDPLITDFDGVSYNGIGAFAFTIDKDNNADTDGDRDLFLRLYDFETRTSYVPIRITNDDTADSMPQLVRKGSGENAVTYLFWMSDDTLKYIDVSSLVKYGVDDNGQILASALEEPQEPEEDIGTGENPGGHPDGDITDENNEMQGYHFTIDEVTNFGKDKNQNASFSDYQVVLDKDNNLYIVWVDNGSDVSKGEPATQEVFAAAMVESEVQATDAGKTSVKMWSMINQLTDTDTFCDEPTAAVTADGKLVIVYNNFTIDMSDKSDGKPKDLMLQSSILEPYCSMEATEIELSDTTPTEGQNVNVNITIKNTGLTASKDGYVAKVYEKKADGTKTLLETFEENTSLVSGESRSYELAYTVGSDIAGTSIQVEVEENGVSGLIEKNSVAFDEKAEYMIESHNAYQGDDSKFYSDVTVTNTGNSKSADGDVLRVKFDGPYASAAEYGVEKDVLAEQKLSLDAGESLQIKLPLTLPGSAFEKYGRIDCIAEVEKQDGNALGEAMPDTIYLYQPADLSFTAKTDKDTDGNYSMKQGEEAELLVSYATSNTIAPVTVEYGTSNDAVAYVKDGKLIATGGGTATITAYLLPLGAATSITVTVKGTEVVVEKPNDPSVVETPKPDDALKLSKTSVTSVVSRKKKQVTLKWAKVKNATSYQVVYATNKNFTKGVKKKTVTKNSITLKKLNEKKTYYFKVRASAKDKSGAVKYGAYSAKKSISLAKRPGKVSGVTVKRSNSRTKLLLKRNKKLPKKATGLYVIVAKDKKMKKDIFAIKTRKRRKTIKKLSKKKTYYVAMQYYKKVKKGVYLYGSRKVVKVKAK